MRSCQLLFTVTRAWRTVPTIQWAHEKCATLEFFTGPVLCRIWKPIHYRSQASEGPLRLTEMDNSGSLLWRKLKVLNLDSLRGYLFEAF